MGFIFKDKREVNIRYKTAYISDENQYIQIYEYCEQNVINILQLFIRKVHHAI